MAARLGVATAWAAALLVTVPAAAGAADEKPAAAATTADDAPPSACINEDIKADLNAKRRMRGTRDRLFQQTNRHEFTLRGGYYVSDLFDGTYIGGVAYAYHMTEDLAVEASAAYTRLTSSGGPELERTFAVLEGRDRTELLFDAGLVWTPAHGKMRLGGSILHFDPYLVAGAGVVDSALASDLAGNAGFGVKFFVGRAIALRFDVRDHVYRQQLLARKVFVNDLTTMLGVSLFLPLGE
ncbi:MAG TPA: outer membrane beta-barrel domain-containing protein [Polyangia bacterium]|nr:outer membrane beta-barrel domain-containing protein [Polyangia bacterium]